MNECNSLLLRSTFQQRYCDGEIPAVLVREGFGWNLQWKIPLKDINFKYYLPIFFEGLRETEKPFDMIANIGLHQMLDVSKAFCYNYLDDIIPQLIYGLTSKNPDIVIKSLMALQHLYNVSKLFLCVHYKDILPVLNDIKERTVLKMNECNSPLLRSTFQQRYYDGEIPAILVREGFGWNLQWKIPLMDINFHYYLPIFFEGLREIQKPFDMIANIGLHQMLDASKEFCFNYLDKIIPQLILGLTSKNPDIVIKCLMALQHLYDATKIFLRVHYMDILPVLNGIKEKIGKSEGYPSIMYDTERRVEIMIMVSETIDLLRREFL